MGEISVKTGNNARNGGKNSLNRLIRCVCGKKIGPDPRNFNQRVSLGRNDLLIRTFPSNVLELGRDTYTVSATADGFRDAASARQSAFKTGSEKCNSLGKKFLLTNENVANTRMGIDTTVTLYFRCLDERDSEYVRPNLQKAPDLRIESK